MTSSPKVQNSAVDLSVGLGASPQSAVGLYFKEFVTSWRPLLAAFVGLGSGYTINNYTNNLFIPELMREFGWRSADIALIGAAATLSVISQPLAGRLTDRFGVRPVALFGVVTAASIFMLLSMMTGAYWMFMTLVTLQIFFIASTTGPVVYSRQIAESFQRARGLALSIAVCAPSLVAVILVPVLSSYIEEHGWRAGYRGLALGTLVVGLLAVWLVQNVGKRKNAPDVPSSSHSTKPATDTGSGDWRELLRSRAIWTIVAGMALCSVSLSFQTTQLSVAIRDLGVSGATASSLIAVYAMGVIGGRIGSGIALDLLPTRLVAFVALALPAVGLSMMAAGVGDYSLLVIAMLTLGLSLGAEGDIAGFLVMTYFPTKFYSTGLGIIFGAISFAAGLGGLMLSALLDRSGSFQMFLLISAVSAAIGGALFLTLRRDTGARDA